MRKCLRIMLLAIVVGAAVALPQPAESYNYGGLCYHREGSGAPHTSQLLWWDGARWIFASLDPWAYDTVATTRCQYGFNGWFQLQSIWWSVAEGRSFIDVYAWGYNANAVAAN